MQQIMPLCHDPIIEIEKLSFSYGDQRVIENLDFMVKERDFVGIIGSNGAGKTTLLRMLVGLLPPAQGISNCSDNRFADSRIGNGSAMSRKNAFNPLFPATVREVVMSGLYNNKNMFRRMTRNHSSSARMHWRLCVSRICQTNGSDNCPEDSSSVCFGTCAY